MSGNSEGLDSLFLRAIAIESLDERRQFLDKVCGDNVELRNEIELLLKSQAMLGSFLERPAPGLHSTIVGRSLEGHQTELMSNPVEHSNSNQNLSSSEVGQSVLRRLEKSMSVRRLKLRTPSDGEKDPIVRPRSTEMPGRVSDSRYRLDGEIARGGMGAIIKGHDIDLGRELAIKVLLDSHKSNPEVVQRFIEEAQVGGQLQHPGIAPVYELGQFEDQRPFFSMKLVKGDTLSKLIVERQSDPTERTRFLGIFKQICETMAYAHSRGVIHRDLKPANIMVGAFG